jgi:dihydroorotate dehydrogenase
MYQHIVKPLLFTIDPERAHHYAIQLAKVGLKLPFMSSILGISDSNNHRDLSRNAMGISFKNPVGLAAGFDKDGKHLNILDKLGFGFIEIGTVTPKPQAGNPKPRLFRLKDDQALINRMGFNNDGVDALVRRLEKYRRNDCILGGNIGKNKDTSNENAVQDYNYCFDRLYDFVDYFTINVSSPNTPGLRALQEKEPLSRLLDSIQAMNYKRSTKPVLLKIAPDMTEDQLLEVCELVTNFKLAGMVLTNTTIDRSNLKTDAKEIQHIGMGGLSGAPLKEKANQVLISARGYMPPQSCLIGVGGISSPENALEKLALGADLIQIYTGFIYQGPSFPSKINKLILNGYDIAPMDTVI